MDIGQVGVWTRADGVRIREAGDFARRVEALGYGADPFFAPPENTRRSREILGPGPWRCPEQENLLESDPEKARPRAGAAMAERLPRA